MGRRSGRGRPTRVGKGRGFRCLEPRRCVEAHGRSQHWPESRRQDRVGHGMIRPGGASCAGGSPAPCTESRRPYPGRLRICSRVDPQCREGRLLRAAPHTLLATCLSKVRGAASCLFAPGLNNHRFHFFEVRKTGLRKCVATGAATEPEKNTRRWLGNSWFLRGAVGALPRDWDVAGDQGRFGLPEDGTRERVPCGDRSAPGTTRRGRWSCPSLRGASRCSRRPQSESCSAPGKWCASRRAFRIARVPVAQGTVRCTSSGCPRREEGGWEARREELGAAKGRGQRRRRLRREEGRRREGGGGEGGERKESGPHQDIEPDHSLVAVYVRPVVLLYEVSRVADEGAALVPLLAEGRLQQPGKEGCMARGKRPFMDRRTGPGGS